MPALFIGLPGVTDGRTYGRFYDS